MRTTLTDDEVMSAIQVYMALRGFKTDRYYNFIWNRIDGFKGVEIDIRPAKFDIKEIEEYAKKH